MRSLLLEFGDSVLSRSEMKSIQGGYGEECKSCKYLRQGMYETSRCYVPPLGPQTCKCTEGQGTENCTVS